MIALGTLLPHPQPNNNRIEQTSNNQQAHKYDKKSAPNKLFSVVIRSVGGAIETITSEGITAVATVFLVIATFMLGWIAVVQIRTTRAQLRAYVFVCSDDDNPEISAEHGLKIWLNIKNTGDTPAYNVRQWVKTAIAPTNYVFQSGENLIQGSGGSAIGPKQEAHILAEFPRGFSAKEQADLLAGTLKIYIFGEVWYSDIFKTRQKTNFRLLLPIDPAGIVRGITFADEGNEAT